MIGALLLAVAIAGAPGDVARWSAGTPPMEQHLRFVRIAPIDGDARDAVREGRACLRTDGASGNRYLYFDVGRRWLRAFGHEPYELEATIEYLDEGTEPIALQYDAMGNEVAHNYREVTWRRTGTGAWRTCTVRLEAAELRNSQHGQSDFRLAAAPGSDPHIAGIALRVLSASASPPPVRPHPTARWPTRNEWMVPLDGFRVVTATPLDEPGRIALERFRTRLRDIGARAGSAGATLVVGRWRGSLGRRYPRTAAAVRRLALDPAGFRRRDGYVLVVERRRPAVVCAVGIESPGAAYAIGDLHVRALRSGRATVLAMPRAPTVDAPALDRREVYLNIGYGLMRPRVTVEDWTAADWRRYIDRLMLARCNTWSFYLWGDSAMLHPLAVAHRDLNRRLHARLREAIRYAHRRGLKVGLQFTPTMVPVEIWRAHPAIQAKLEYVYPGTVCPSREESWRWMREVQEREIAAFSECDFFSLWFYDVGGCFCETCRDGERQLAVLLRQARTFAPIVRRANPKAVFQVMAWALWRYERMHAFSIRDRFVASLRTWFAERRIPLEMADGIYVDPGAEPLFAAMRREGLRAKAFLYQTNIETGQPLPIVQTRYMAKWAPEIVRAGATSAFLMRMEAGTKQADDAIAGRYLWAPETAPGEALLDAARQFTGDSSAARIAWDALRRIDDFAWYGRAGGGAGAAAGARIADLCARTVAASPPALRPALEWLAGAGRAYAVLGRAVDARDDEDEDAVARLDPEFTAALRRSPLYRGQAGDAPYWRNLFRSALVRYFHAGWSTYHF